MIKVCEVCEQTFKTRTTKRKYCGTACATEARHIRAMNADIEEHLDKRIEVDEKTGCWNWIRGKNTLGYGITKVRGQRYLAHRLAYISSFGPIPEGMLVCHKCDNPSCCNPEHLFLGNNAANMADMKKKGRGRSVKGEDNHRAKMTVEGVERIFELRAKGMTIKKIAEILNVSRSLVGQIAVGKRWASSRKAGTVREKVAVKACAVEMIAQALERNTTPKPRERRMFVAEI